MIAYNYVQLLVSFRFTLCGGAKFIVTTRSAFY